MGILKTSDHIQIKIKIPNPCQEPPVSSKARYQDLKDLDVLCTFKIKIESQDLDHGCIKDQWPYPNQDQDVKPQSLTSSVLQSPKYGLRKDKWPYANQDQDPKPQSGTSSIFQSPKWGLKGQGFSLHLQNQDKEPQIRTWWTLILERLYFENGSVWSQH